MTLEAAIRRVIEQEGGAMTLGEVTVAVEKLVPSSNLNLPLAVHATLLLLKTNGVVRTPQPGYFELVH